MGTAKGKSPLGHDVENCIVELFTTTCEKLGPPKYRVLEVAIEVFAHLPRELQYALKGYDEADRKMVLDLIAGLSQQSIQSERGTKAKSAKSG